jgi:ketosteroid isomerase-like protein
MDTLERRVQVLEDREEIKEAVGKYSLHILNNEAPKIPDLFAEDGVFRIDSVGLNITGREALIAFFSRMTPGATYPFVQTTAIVLDGDTASHIGVMDNPAHIEGRKGYFGIYEDRLRRVDGRWLFTDRSFRFLQGGPPGVGAATNEA